jgi:hypothetical protein
VSLHSLLLRLRSGPEAKTPEALTVLHSADMDIHLDGVVRSPTARPPWPGATWHRYGEARRREPSATAKVLLDLHPAFVDCDPANPGWLDVERAETLAVEWSGLTPLEVAQWLSAHPAVSAQQARDLAGQGWHPRDAGLVLPERVVDLTGRLARERRIG